MVNDYLKLNKGVEKTERKKPSRKYFTGDSENCITTQFRLRF